MVCLVALARLVEVSARQLASPYDLMYESPNLASLRLVQAGQSPYDPAIYAGPPFTLTPYTPLWFLALAPLPEIEGRPFLVARLVSLAAIAVSALLLVLWTRRAAWALLAVGVFLLSWPVTAYATYLRMDPLAVAISGLCVLALRQPTRGRVALAAVLAVLAAATKQTYVAAGLGGLVFLLARDRALAARFVAVAAVTGAALAGLATLAWGRGFWFSVFVLRADPVRLDTMVAQLLLQLRAPVFVLLLLAAAAAIVAAWRRHGAALLGRTPALAFLLASAAVLLATLGKTGSSAVYFLELALALPLWLTDGTVLGVVGPRARAVFLAVLLACVGVDAATSAAHRDLHSFRSNSEANDGAYYASVRTGLARAGYARPRVLNLGPPRHAYGVADDVCMNDVSTYELAFRQGMLDARLLEDALRAKAYDVVVLSFHAAQPSVAEHSLGGALLALEESYRLLWRDRVASYYGR